MIRALLGVIGASIESCFPSPEVARARALAKFADVPAGFPAAGTGPGTLSDGSSLRRPSPGTPVTVDQVLRLRLVIEVHYIAVMSIDGHVQCHCRRWEGPIAAHTDHVADVACEHLADEARKAFATSKFQK